MNWRLGFFRVWIVFSILWVTLCGVGGAVSIFNHTGRPDYDRFGGKAPAPDQFDQTARITPPPPPGLSEPVKGMFDDLIPSSPSKPRIDVTEILTVLSVAFGFPLLLLLAGKVFVWITRGFTVRHP